jgi:cytidylate kinase
MKIAITGKMCSGKSFIANMICQLDNSYNVYSYGQKIKEIAIDLFNMKTKNRSLIISIAEDMKKHDPDVWANYIMKKIQYKNNIVIDDLRFQNELDLLSSDWIIIRLNITNTEQRRRLINLYSDDVQDHLKYLEDISEKNNLDLNKKYRIIDIDTEKETYEQIRLKIFLLLTKR